MEALDPPVHSSWEKALFSAFNKILVDSKGFEPSTSRNLRLNRVFSFSGEPGTGIPIDGFNELVWI